MRFASDKQRRAVFASMNRFSSRSAGDRFAGLVVGLYPGSSEFSQVNPYAAAAATSQNISYPELYHNNFANEPGHFPKPDYSKCNAGHELVEVYDEKHNRYDWDCPICMRKMRWAREQEGEFAVDPVKSYNVARTAVDVPFNFPVNTKRFYDGRIYVYTGEAYTLLKALEEMAPSMSMGDSARAKVIAEDLGTEIEKQKLEGKDNDGMVFLSEPKLDFIEKVFGSGEFSIDPAEAEEMARQFQGWEEYDKESNIDKKLKSKQDKDYAFAVKLDSKLKRILGDTPKVSKTNTNIPKVTNVDVTDYNI